MTVKFRAFGFNIGGGPRPKTFNEVYSAVAAFAGSIGDRLVSITGSLFGETHDSYTDGEIVVWYKE